MRGSVFREWIGLAGFGFGVGAAGRDLVFLTREEVAVCFQGPGEMEEERFLCRVAWVRVLRWSLERLS